MFLQVAAVSKTPVAERRQHLLCFFSPVLYDDFMTANVAECEPSRAFPLSSCIELFLQFPVAVVDFVFLFICIGLLWTNGIWW